jgi:hypothetical protein
MSCRPPWPEAARRATSASSPWRVVRLEDCGASRLAGRLAGWPGSAPSDRRGRSNCRQAERRAAHLATWVLGLRRVSRPRNARSRSSRVRDLQAPALEARITSFSTGNGSSRLGPPPRSRDCRDGAATTPSEPVRRAALPGSRRAVVGPRTRTTSPPRSATTRPRGPRRERLRGDAGGRALTRTGNRPVLQPHHGGAPLGSAAARAGTGSEPRLHGWPRSADAPPGRDRPPGPSGRPDDHGPRSPVQHPGTGLVGVRFRARAP